jgi:OOP family OmpA-OmpF porin
MNTLRLTPFYIATLLTVCPVIANAETPETYIGVGYGQYKFEFDDDDIDTDFSDNRDLGKIYIGANFNEMFGIELSYLDFDKASDAGFDADIEGLSLAGTLSFPISDHFSVFAKAGWFAWEADISGSVGPLTVSNDIDGDDLFYGVGLKIGLVDNPDLRIEYDRYELDGSIDPELDVASVAVQLVF